MGSEETAASRLSKLPTAMGEDGCQCNVEINSDNEKFWSATATDIYYNCDDTTYATDYSTAVADDATASTADDVVTTNVDALNPLENCAGSNTYSNDTPNIESADDTDWEIAYSDDDPDLPWCTRAGEAGTWSPFQCTAIKCILQRKFATEEDKVADVDEFYDFEFFPTTVETETDTMNIRSQRAKIFFNKDTFTVPFLNSQGADGYTIAIYKGANSLHKFAAALAVASTTTLFLF